MNSYKIDIKTSEGAETITTNSEDYYNNLGLVLPNLLNRQFSSYDDALYFISDLIEKSTEYVLYSNDEDDEDDEYDYGFENASELEAESILETVLGVRFFSEEVPTLLDAEFYVETGK